MRGLLREFFALRAQCPRRFGIIAPKGAEKFLSHLPQLLERHRERLPEPVRRVVLAFREEVQALEAQMKSIDKEFAALARTHPVIRALVEIPGIGAITATALYTSVGNIHLFKNGRKLASRLGITPREHSSAGKRRRGRISKQGDPYLRTLLIHGARAALRAAQAHQRKGRPLTHLQQRAVQKAQELRHTNQAAVALANKLARIAWAVWKHERRFDGNYRSQAPAA
jgi:transposase